MSGARIRVQIGRARARPDEYGRTWHPVTVRYRGRDCSADVWFAIVNDQVPYSLGECSDEAFEAIVGALEHVGRTRLRAQLQEARS